VEWIHLAQDWMQWAAFLTTVIKTCVPFKALGICMLSGDLLAYQKGLRSVQLIMTRVITQTTTLTNSSPVTVSMATINQRHHPLDHLNHYY